MSSWVTEKERLITLAKTFDKSIKLYTKDNWFCKTIAWILFIVTFGKFKREKFLTVWATSIAHIQFYPKEYEAWHVEALIPHESRHTWQFRVLGFYIHPIVGLPQTLIVYSLLLLPMLFAFGRFFMELDATKAAWKYKLKNQPFGMIEMNRKARVFAEKITSYKYAWSIPRSWAEWFSLRTAAKIYEEEYGTSFVG